jgi:N utilization substance protein B
MPRRPSRKQARRDALFVLYQREVRGESPEQLYRELREREGYAADGYTKDLVEGVVAQTARLDTVIGRHSRDWPVERLAPLERSLLRLALYEISHGIVPPEVAVDEAVRLTRRYSTDEAGALVNGILGGYLRETAAGAPGAGGGTRAEESGPGGEAGNADAGGEPAADEGRRG